MANSRLMQSIARKGERMDGQKCLILSTNNGAFILMLENILYLEYDNTDGKMTVIFKGEATRKFKATSEQFTELVNRLKSH